MKQKSYLLAITLILFSVVALGRQSGGTPAIEQSKSRAQSSRAPRIPVILDGVPYQVGELPTTERPRFYVLTRKDQRKGVMHAFSSQESADAFMRYTMDQDTKGNSSAQIVPLATCQNTSLFTIFNTARGGGNPDNLLMYNGDPFLGPAPPLYTNLDFGGWNNTISYVAAACNGFPTAIYSCRNFEMNKTVACQDPDRYLIQPGMIIPDLTTVGFNNRTSSAKFGF